MRELFCVLVCSYLNKKQGVWSLWETAVFAVFQVPVGALLASTGTAASMTRYAAARRSNAAGLICPSVECRRRWL